MRIYYKRTLSILLHQRNLNSDINEINIQNRKEPKMKKKYLYPSVIGAVLTAVIFIYSINVMAYEKGTQKEYQSDRTLLKEIISNQRKTHALLNEIKASRR